MKIYKKQVYPVIILAIMVASVIVLFTTQDMEDLQSLVHRFDWRWISAAAAVMLAYYLLDAVVLHSITGFVEPRQRFGRSLRLAMIGSFFNAVTPFASGGQPVMVYGMMEEDIEPAHAVTIVVLKSMVYQFVTLCYTVIAFCLCGNRIRSLVPHAGFLFLLGTTVTAVLVFLYLLILFDHVVAGRLVMFIIRFLSRIRLIRHSGALHRRVRAQLKVFRKAAGVYRRNGAAALPVCLFEALRLTALYSIPYLLYRSLEAGGIPYPGMLATMSIVTILSAFFPTPGGSGGAESIAFIFFRRIFTSVPVLPVLLIWRLFTYYLHIILGGAVSLLAPEHPLSHWKQPADGGEVSSGIDDGSGGQRTA